MSCEVRELVCERRVAIVDSRLLREERRVLRAFCAARRSVWSWAVVVEVGSVVAVAG